MVGALGQVTIIAMLHVGEAGGQNHVFVTVPYPQQVDVFVSGRTEMV